MFAILAFGTQPGKITLLVRSLNILLGEFKKCSACLFHFNYFSLENGIVITMIQHYSYLVLQILKLRVIMFSMVNSTQHIQAVLDTRFDPLNI